MPGRWPHSHACDGYCQGSGPAFTSRALAKAEWQSPPAMHASQRYLRPLLASFRDLGRANRGQVAATETACSCGQATGRRPASHCACSRCGGGPPRLSLVQTMHGMREVGEQPCCQLPSFMHA